MTRGPRLRRKGPTPRRRFACPPCRVGRHPLCWHLRFDDLCECRARPDADTCTTVLVGWTGDARTAAAYTAMGLPYSPPRFDRAELDLP